MVAGRKSFRSKGATNSSRQARQRGCAETASAHCCAKPGGGKVSQRTNTSLRPDSSSKGDMGFLAVGCARRARHRGYRESCRVSGPPQPRKIELQLAYVFHIEEPLAREGAGEIGLSLEQIAHRRRQIFRSLQVSKSGNAVCKSPIMSIGSACRTLRPFVGEIEFLRKDMRESAI